MNQQISNQQPLKKGNKKQPQNNNNGAQTTQAYYNNIYFNYIIPYGIIIATLLPILFLWNLEFLASNKFAAPGDIKFQNNQTKTRTYSVSQYISTTQGTGAMAALFYYPILFLWQTPRPQGSKAWFYSLFGFQFFFGMFLAYTTTYNPFLHFVAVGCFSLLCIIHMYVNIYHGLVNIYSKVFLWLANFGLTMVLLSQFIPVLASGRWFYVWESLGLTGIVLYTPIEFIMYHIIRVRNNTGKSINQSNQTIQGQQVELAQQLKNPLKQKLLQVKQRSNTKIVEGLGFDKSSIPQNNQIKGVSKSSKKASKTDMTNANIFAIVGSILPVIYIWSLPLLAKTSFINDLPENSVWDIWYFLNTPQANGAMAAVFFFPLLLLWDGANLSQGIEKYIKDKNYNPPQTVWPLFGFEASFQMMLMFPHSYAPKTFQFFAVLSVICIILLNYIQRQSKLNCKYASIMQMVIYISFCAYMSLKILIFFNILGLSQIVNYSYFISQCIGYTALICIVPICGFEEGHSIQKTGTFKAVFTWIPRGNGQ